MSVPTNPKICHILHHDKLASVIANNFLLSDFIITSRNPNGTTIGMSKIKKRRLTQLTLQSHPDLFVGQCVPFYFSPRSIMLYIMYMGNHPEVEYAGGQEPIIHLVADLNSVVKWADENNRRWAFSTSNAGSVFFEDYSDLNKLDKIDWNAVNTNYWSNCREEKQAEFLIEEYFPWTLIEYIGVISTKYDRIVNKILKNSTHKPKVGVKPNWYYP